MRFGKKVSVRGRLLLIVTTLLVAGFLTTNAISFLVSRNALKTTILHNELPLTSSNIYSEIQADLLRPVFVSSLMSNDTFLRDWLLAGETDPGKVVRYLDEFRKKYGVFTSFLVSEHSRNYYHFTGTTKTVSEKDPRDVWFFRVRAMTAPYEINIDPDQAQGDAITVFVNYRVLDYQGKFLGVTGVGLKMDAIANIISRYHDDYQRNIYFLDPQGRVTVRSNHSVITENNIHDAPGIRDIANAILSQDSGYFEYTRDGESMLLTTRFIKELGWRVVVEQRESVALKALWHGFFTNLAIGLGIILITTTAIGYTINLYQKRLEVMAHSDKLTGIGNRQVFDIAIDYALKLWRRTPHPLSVILFDIDHFKQVNDTLGHLQGDIAIQKVVGAIKRLVRDSDVLCRWGGEEIIILADNCPLDEAVALAEDIRLAIAREPIFQPDAGLRLTISAGVAQAQDDDTADTLITRADMLLYQAKDQGRNRVLPAPPSSSDEDEMGLA